jgi:hypothetical protein
MKSNGSALPTMRLPTWLSLTCGLVSAPIFYFIFRASVHAPSLSPAEFAFLVSYTLACSIYAGFAYSFASRSQWPGLLNNYWLRLVAFILLLIAMHAGLQLFPLSAFYQAVIDKSFLFLVLPLILISARAVKTTPANEALVASLPAHADEDVTFGINPKKAIFLLIGGAAFPVASLFLMRENPVLAWIAIGFFGLALPLGIIMLLPGAYGLILRKDDFIMLNCWRRMTVRWADICDLTVINLNMGSRVGWNYVPGTNRKAVAWITASYGRNAFLLDDYGVAPEEMCKIMLERKNRAGS